MLIPQDIFSFIFNFVLINLYGVNYSALTRWN